MSTAKAPPSKVSSCRVVSYRLLHFYLFYFLPRQGALLEGFYHYHRHHWYQHNHRHIHHVHHHDLFALNSCPGGARAERYWKAEEPAR